VTKPYPICSALQEKKTTRMLFDHALESSLGLVVNSPPSRHFDLQGMVG
jgi:hypothetical protein